MSDEVDNDNVVDLEDVSDPETPPNKNVRYVISANQLYSISLAELNLPPGLCAGYWKLNTFNQRLTTPSDVVLAFYCPLFIGPCCTPLRRKGWLRLFLTLTFWVMLLQVIIFFALLSVSHNPLHNTTINPSILSTYGCLSSSIVRKTRQYWRCLSPILLHGSFGHLCINVFLECAFVLGREAQWNALRTYGSFILSNIAGAFMTLVFSPQTCYIGSSNGIFGVFGSFISLYFIMFETLQWRHRIGALFMISLLVIFLIFAGVQPETDSYGHIGSFLFGLVFGVIIFVNRIKKRNHRVIALILGSIFSIILLLGPMALWVFEWSPNVIAEFFKKLFR